MRVRELFSLEGRAAIITGGSRGLGLQIAEALGEMGARLVISARKSSELDEAVTHLAGLGVTAHAVVADVSSGAGIAALVDAALEQCGAIDILVNNAGATWGASAEDHPIDAWDKVMTLNVRSNFLLCQTLARRCMIPRRYGRILNVASVAGLRGNPGDVMQTAAYNTSKGAVVNMTRTLAGEWGRYNINVNALAPGFFPTKMTRGLMEHVGEDTLIAHTPRGTLGGPDDLKGAAVLLTSEAGRHITGQTLPVDGGWTAV